MAGEEEKEGTQPAASGDGDTSVIDAEPTKAFFVDILIRDIPLEQAVLDLVDNSVDGAKRQGASFEGREVAIELSAEKFRIVDNCGGFDKEEARKHAFRFGRVPHKDAIERPIGQFGVGMKRALFKFGRHFVVSSATSAESWAVDVDVDKWESDPAIGWHFPWASIPKTLAISTEKPGTEIVVDNLREEVAARFETKHFENSLAGLIKSKHREFISAGLSISINGTHLDATSVYVLMRDHLRPGVDIMTLEQAGKQVAVRIVVGVGESVPTEAGWYVICNGRIVVEADRTPTTGWGHIEEQAKRVVIPRFHNEFARFRGIVSFDSDDAALLPWKTTKTDVDHDSPIWQKVYPRMLEMMRPVITYLSDLDEDIDEHTRESSPMLSHVRSATRTKIETLTTKMDFIAPKRGELVVGPRTQRIQYSKTVEDIDFLKRELDVDSASGVGSKTFDMILQRLRGE